ncbi:MAG: hypothetical protein ACOY5Y_19385 [Pseudomonadota bacterium]
MEGKALKATFHFDLIDHGRHCGVVRGIFADGLAPRRGRAVQIATVESEAHRRGLPARLIVETVRVRESPSGVELHAELEAVNLPGREEVLALVEALEADLGFTFFPFHDEYC